MTYEPARFRALAFHDAIPEFRDGSDTPRAWLERCLETIAKREPEVRAFVTLNEEGARAAADASSARWKANQPLSPIDGMPVAIKDLLETKDMPTEMGCAAYAGNFPKRDNAAVWALREAGQPNEIVHMWNYPSVEARMKTRAAVDADADWQGFRGKVAGMVEEMQNVLLIPTSYSVMK